MDWDCSNWSSIIPHGVGIGVWVWVWDWDWAAHGSPEDGVNDIGSFRSVRV